MIAVADWNALSEIAKARLDRALLDVVGSGAPERGGAAVEDGDGFRLVLGTAYVDGIRATLEAEPPAPPGTAFAFDAQADFPQPPPLPGGPYLLYLNVWERAVLGLEAGELIDVALHGADTTTRTRTMAQVKWAPAGFDAENPGLNPPIGGALLTLTLREGLSAADGTLRRRDRAAGPGRQLSVPGRDPRRPAGRGRRARARRAEVVARERRRGRADRRRAAGLHRERLDLRVLRRRGDAGGERVPSRPPPSPRAGGLDPAPRRAGRGLPGLAAGGLRSGAPLGRLCRAREIRRGLAHRVDGGRRRDSAPEQGPQPAAVGSASRGRARPRRRGAGDAAGARHDDGRLELAGYALLAGDYGMRRCARRPMRRATSCWPRRRRRHPPPLPVPGRGRRRERDAARQGRLPALRLPAPD